MIGRVGVVGLASLLLGCHARTVDLGRDAMTDGPAIDGSTCRCRITPCRGTPDCALIGGACGPDQFCVGDFGSCTTDSICQQQATDSVCTKATDSTTSCN